MIMYSVVPAFRRSGVPAFRRSGVPAIYVGFSISPHGNEVGVFYGSHFENRGDPGNEVKRSLRRLTLIAHVLKLSSRLILGDSSVIIPCIIKIQRGRQEKTR